MVQVVESEDCFSPCYLWNVSSAHYGMYLLLIPICKPMHFYLISRRINLKLCVCNKHILMDR